MVIASIFSNLLLKLVPLNVNEKFDEAEKVRKKYADVSDENRASLFNENESHENIFSNISDVDLINLSINTKNSDFGAFAVKNDSSDKFFFK